MKWNSLKLRPKFGWQLLGCLCASLVVAACSRSSTPADEPTASAAEEQPASVVNLPQSGKKLTELAGQASMPDNEAASTVQQASAEDKTPYIGRYHVQISCKDDFVQCSEGSADPINTPALAISWACPGGNAKIDTKILMVKPIPQRIAVPYT